MGLPDWIANLAGDPNAMRYALGELATQGTPTSTAVAAPAGTVAQPTPASAPAPPPFASSPQLPTPSAPIPFTTGPASMPAPAPAPAQGITLAPTPDIAPTGLPGLAGGVAGGLVKGGAPVLQATADSVTALLKSNGPALLLVGATVLVLGMGGHRGRR